MLDNLLKEPYLGCHYLSVIRARAVGLVTITHRAFRYWKKRVGSLRLILLFTLPIN